MNVKLERRLGWKWLGLTLGIALVLRLGVSLLALLLGHYAAPYLGDISPLAAALILGVPWAALHLVRFLPGMWSAGESPLPRLSVVLLLSVLTTWAYVRTGRHGVIAATLLHGGQNGLIFLNGGVTPASLAPWLMVVVYARVVVGIVVADARVMLGRRSGTAPAVAPAG